MYWVKYVYKMNRYLSTEEDVTGIFLCTLCGESLSRWICNPA
jgi:hypothetical protein